MSVAALLTAIEGRFDSQYLKEITNNDSSATTINEARLTLACQDAIGEFERVTGDAYDTDSYSHVSILIKGVLYFLEYYKARDVALINSRQRDFYTSLGSFRGIKYISPSTTSNLKITREASGTIPDMDRNRNVFAGTSKKTSSSYTIESTINP